MATRDLAAKTLARLRNNIEGTVHTDLPTRALYSTDASIYQIMPLGVVFPRSTADIQSLMEFANDTQTPIIFRGGGTGLAGETLGEALIADCSRHMISLEDIDLSANLARVQNGLVLERLNARLRAEGKQFGPDPGSASRCTLGGMAANNAAGMHSLVHGVTRDNIHSMEIILSDGSRLEVGPHAYLPSPNSMAERIHAGLEAMLTQNADLIEAKALRHLRRHRAGYLLHDVLLTPQNGASPAPGHPELKPLGSSCRLDLAKLISGSEGTLAAIGSLTLKITDQPRETGLGLFCFRKTADAADAVPLILEHSPASIEMLDHSVLRMARETGRLGADGVVPSAAKSILMVEFWGENTVELQCRLEGVWTALRRGTPVLDEFVLAIRPEDRDRIWAIRSSSEPLLNRRPGRKRAIAFVEDAAVGPDQLGAYIRAVEETFQSRGIEYGVYGHAGVGVLHVRPFLDTSDPEDRKHIEECADAIYSTVLSLGGSVSGEHGDGLVRTQYLPRQYGSLYPIFGEVKALFDPKGILNPGKIWRPVDQSTLVENLRRKGCSGFRTRKLEVVWEAGEFEKEVELCNGCGECKIQDRCFTMCPAFKDFLDEASSPRAKANLIRTIANGCLDEDYLSDAQAKQIMDRCINCKGCHIECPLNVNIPKLMLEAKAQYVRKHGQDLPNVLLGLSEYGSQVGSFFAPLANWAGKNKLMRRAMEWGMGIDARRPLPHFQYMPLSRFRAACPHPHRPVDKVALFLDLFARYNDPSLAFDFLDILRANDVEVIIPDQRPSGLPAMDYASMDLARWIVKANANSFAKCIAQGYTVVATEPSAALALHEEALAFSADLEVRTLAEHTMDAMQFLLNLKRSGRLATQGLKSIAMRLGYHAPCHVKALKSQNATLELIRMIPGITIKKIEEGCCGIAGTWGMKKQNYEDSIRIGLPLFEALRDPAIDIGLSECSTCRIQMEHGSRKKAIHPITLLAQAYRKK